MLDAIHWYAVVALTILWGRERFLIPELQSMADGLLNVEGE